MHNKQPSRMVRALIPMTPNPICYNLKLPADQPPSLTHLQLRYSAMAYHSVW